VHVDNRKRRKMEMQGLRLDNELKTLDKEIKRLQIEKLKLEIHRMKCGDVDCS
jgi:hypothetical protein